jgi:hypothetical protein
MEDSLHPELKLLLDFYLQQRSEPPREFACSPGVIPAPSFFSVSALQQHLNNPLLNPDWVLLRARGQAIPLEPACLWKIVQTKKILFMDKELINEQLNRGAAIVLEGLDILDTAINSFVAGLDAALPCALSNCVAFFSQRENEAYGGHCDTDDVLVIQIAGEKRWHLFTPQQRRYVNNSPLTNEQMGKQIAEVVMRPGDALYVRAGVPHLCQTTGDHSLHLAFDLCDRTPNIEQITHEANTRYNHACEDPYAPAAKVVEKYTALLNTEKFQNDLVSATQQIKNNAVVFRQRIGRSSGIRALSKYSNLK